MEAHNYTHSLTHSFTYSCRTEGSDLEEGEIEDGGDLEAAELLGCEWNPEKHVYVWLALALFERLSGDGLRALEAAEKALAAAAGRTQVGCLGPARP